MKTTTREIKEIAQALSPKTKYLLHDLRNGPLYEWDARRTVQANSWDLLRLNSADHLTLTNLGRRVANLLEKGNSHR